MNMKILLKIFLLPIIFIIFFLLSNNPSIATGKTPNIRQIDHQKYYRSLIEQSQVILRDYQFNNSNPEQKPTPTPSIKPTIADSRTINIIIGFSVISVMVVLFGLWLNRTRLYWLFHNLLTIIRNHKI